MSRMTSSERILKALSLQEPDAIPTFEIEIDESVMDAILPGASYEDFCEHLDIDALCYHEFLGDKYEVLDEAKRVVRDQWGAVKQYTPGAFVPIPREWAIESEGDLERYASPDPDDPSRYTRIQQGVQRFKGDRAIVACIRPFSTLKDSLLGDMNLFRAVATNPDFVDRLNAVIADYYTRYVKNLIDVGVDAVFEVADWAATQGPMVSPKQTERFIIPLLKDIVEQCHARGVKCLKHSDGNIWPIFDLIVNTGVDCVDPIDPLGGMDLGEAKIRYGQKVCLMGNVDCGQLLSFGSTSEVREAVKTCIRQAGAAGGYICASSNSIHGAVKPENYVEMIGALREYGVYPLSI